MAIPMRTFAIIKARKSPDNTAIKPTIQPTKMSRKEKIVLIDEILK